ncbi:MAG: histidine phosphatase family protein [Gammaproteobacteria bacterium]|nr:histidine phosphatase family protein [Gammaproteobacteria bacterium]NIP46814.1 histidine phosphatase family protein [Gammaproteobacteria bacterium]NIW02626.1 histidine phosphatase family protein [Gammaproteobacteria bacterium]NIW55511.1 histidine phosphatase family protein [Gammaproteobacteria bacterium]NIY00066.1 histidine phosphatase family protein [Gammaproteobacteria bacterium]
MSILLVRHGETALNAARIVQHPETPLNERGMGQARRVAERLADFPVEAIVSSDYRRAHMTAEAIAAATGLPIVIQESLRERNFGEARGVPHADLPVDLYAPDFHPRGGESWSMFHERVTRAWQQITARAAGTEGDLVVVSHALVCRSLVENHLTLAPHMDATVPRWPNTALTVIDSHSPWEVTVLACGAHLGGELADDSAARS